MHALCAPICCGAAVAIYNYALAAARHVAAQENAAPRAAQRRAVVLQPLSAAAHHHGVMRRLTLCCFVVMRRRSALSYASTRTEEYWYTREAICLLQQRRATLLFTARARHKDAYGTPRTAPVSARGSVRAGDEEAAPRQRVKKRCAAQPAAPPLSPAQHMRCERNKNAQNRGTPREVASAVGNQRPLRCLICHEKCHAVVLCCRTYMSMLLLSNVMRYSAAERGAHGEK